MYKTDDDMLARATVETWVIKAEKGEQDCCPKCDGKVFEAEKMVSASVSFWQLSSIFSDSLNFFRDHGITKIASVAWIALASWTV